MSRSFHQGDRRVRVRGVKKDPPDLRRLARALIALVEAEAEAEARADGVEPTVGNGTASKCAPTRSAKPRQHGVNG